MREREIHRKRYQVYCLLEMNRLILCFSEDIDILSVNNSGITVFCHVSHPLCVCLWSDKPVWLLTSSLTVIFSFFPLSVALSPEKEVSSISVGWVLWIMGNVRPVLLFIPTLCAALMDTHTPQRWDIYHGIDMRSLMVGAHIFYNVSLKYEYKVFSFSLIINAFLL